MSEVMQTFDPPEIMGAKDVQEKRFWKKLQMQIDHAGAGTLVGSQRVASLPALKMMA
jgi:hypothetical protein